MVEVVVQQVQELLEQEELVVEELDQIQELEQQEL